MLQAEPGALSLEEIPSPTRSRARAGDYNSHFVIDAHHQKPQQFQQSQLLQEQTQKEAPEINPRQPRKQRPNHNQLYQHFRNQPGPHRIPCSDATLSRLAADDLSSDASPSSCVEVDPSELTMLERVGMGATAEVHRAAWHGTDVAVKRMLVPLSFAMDVTEKDFQFQLNGRRPSEVELGRRLAKMEEQRQQKLQRQHLAWFRRELALLQELRHPNLVLFMGAAAVGDTPPLIVSEFCEGGTLFKLLHERQETRLTWSQKLKSALDIAKGMNFLHRRRVIHRDLKSLNLLLAGEVIGPDDAPWIKISDFGLSRRLPSEAIASELHQFPGVPCPAAAGSSPVMTGGLGTCLWMAPELLSGRDYNERADVYSYGIVLFELICRRLPFDGARSHGAVSEAVRAVCNGHRPDLQRIPSWCPPLLRQLMELSWAQRPEARPAFASILEDLAVITKDAQSPLQIR